MTIRKKDAASMTATEKKEDSSSSPEWVLNNVWGVGRDPMNWRLYRKTEKGNWKIVGYFSSIKMLCRSLRQDIELSEDTGAVSIVDHLDQCLVVFQKTVNELYKNMGIEDARDATSFNGI